jgi:tripartite-type tricarboxylate transporter receptor subunit TctC
MSGELLKKMAGIEMLHVPYKGGGPAVQDLVGGQVPVGVLGSTPLIPHHRAGRIRIIAFTSRERFAPMPEIPTLHESGLTGFDTTQWLGILAPKGTSGEVVNRIHRETKLVLEMQDVKERLAQAALQAVGSTPREFDALIRADLERWTAIARDLKLEPQ